MYASENFIISKLLLNANDNMNNIMNVINCITQDII